MCALEKIDLELAPGECAVLTGASGSGKTSLLLALAGLLRDGSGEGVVHIGAPRVTGGLPVGVVLQNAETQLLCSTVDDELRLGLDALGCSPAERAERARRALGAVGLDGFGPRNVEQLSAGEKQRTALAAALALEPAALLLDEPTAQLDPPAIADLVATLERLKRAGHALLIAEHEPGPFRRIADRWLALDAGVLCEREHPPAAPAAVSWSAPRDGGEVLALERVSLARPDGRTLLEGVELSVCRGERVHLFGANGSGKSTLLRACVGLEPLLAGHVRVDGDGAPVPERMPGRASLLLQSPERQLFEDTVQAEVAFAVERLPLSAPARAARVDEALERCEIAGLRERSPLRLSYGEQHRVALAAALAPRPGLLLLDEPFAGLDPEQRLRLLRRLAEAAACGAAVVIASHGELPDPHWATRRIDLREGSLVER